MKKLLLSGVLFVAALVVTTAAVGAALKTIGAAGVNVTAPADWSRVTVAPGSKLVDPQTVLVAGTEGVTPIISPCQVSSYRVPDDGAVVVIVRWKGKASSAIPRDRSELEEMKLQREYFSCYDGRGASGRIALDGHGYQVSVMVGDSVRWRGVVEALTVARSFDVASD